MMFTRATLRPRHSLSFVLTGSSHPTAPGDLLILDRELKTAASFRRNMLRPRGKDARLRSGVCQVHQGAGTQACTCGYACRQGPTELGASEADEQDQAHQLLVNRGMRSPIPP